MAITTAQLQAAITSFPNMGTQVVRELPPYGGALQYWYLVGRNSFPGRAKMVATTASDNAATQATDAKNQLRAWHPSGA